MSSIVAAAEIGMLDDVERLRAISHNLANVGTVGYKRELAVTSAFDRELLATSSVSDLAELGRSLMTMVTDRSAGTLTHTDNPLDLAIEGDGFFAVDTGQEILYTRQGAFHLNADGELVTTSGHRVLTTTGAMRLTSPAPVIDAQGNLRDAGVVVGQIRVINIDNPETLTALGNGLYVGTDATVATVADSARVRQGFTEAANVVAMNEMIKMIETVRHFEATQKLLQGYGAMLDRAITDLGNVQ